MPFHSGHGRNQQLCDAAFGGATPVEPKAISPTDPAARYTAAGDGPAVCAYSDNHLIDLKHAVIMDVEATTAVRQAEVGAAKTMIDRTADQFEVTPSRLAADAGYGSAGMLGWLVDERGIEPHVRVFDKSERTDGSFLVSTSSTFRKATSMFFPAERNCANAAACSHRRDPKSPRKASSSIAPASATARLAR